MPTRVTQLSQQALTLNNVFGSQQRLRDLQIQIATGQRSRNYAGIAEDASRLVSLKSIKVRTDQFAKNNAIITARIEQTDSAISTVFDSLSDLRKLIIQARNDAVGDKVPLAEVAQNLLDVVTGQLNSKENGRFVFAGSMTDTQPVTVPVPDPAVFGAPDASYYNGDSTELTARIDETTTITYGITASRTGFQQAIAALKGAIQADATKNTSLLDTSLGLASQALQTIAGYRAETGSDLATIDRANQRNGDFVTFVEGRVSDIQNVDVPTAVSQLASEQTVLQASFLTLARVTNLSLVSFLN